MTIEEIINGLEFTKAMFLFDPSTGEEKTKNQLNNLDRTTVDACEGAIDLLKQYKDVLDTNVGDLISRKDAIDVASRECHELRGIFSYIEQGLKELPSAQPNIKKGKWILKKELEPLPWDSAPLNWDNYDEDTHSEWKEFYHCSNCDWKSGDFKGGNYCRNCGADMREGDSDDK